MMIRNRVFSVLVACAALAGVSRPGVSSTFKKLDLDELRGRSEAVVRAQVVHKESYWNAEGSMIFTDVTLSVKQRLHGKAADEITLRVPGGTVDGFTAVMLGAAEFDEGSEVVVFVGRWKDGKRRAAGYSQGVSRVRRDALGNLMLQGGIASGLPVSDLARRLGVRTEDRP